MTEQEKEKSRNELRQILDRGFQNSEKANAKGAIKSYWNSMDFIAFTNDGRMCNYQEFKKEIDDYYDLVSSQKITRLKEGFIFLSSDAVIYYLLGEFDAQLKNGGIMKLHPYAVTLIFKRIKREWKIIYSHDSSLPPVMPDKGLI